MYERSYDTQRVKNKSVTYNLRTNQGPCKRNCQDSPSFFNRGNILTLLTQSLSNLFNVFHCEDGSSSKP